MAYSGSQLDRLLEREYPAGIVTDIDADSMPPFVVEWWLAACRHGWTLMAPPWSSVHYPPSDRLACSGYPVANTRRLAPASLNGVREDNKLEGTGGAISTATASLVTEAVKGRTGHQAHALSGPIHARLADPHAAGALGKLAIPGCMHGYPMSAPYMRPPEPARQPSVVMPPEFHLTGR